MKKKVVIIGGGVAGMYLAERLSPDEFDISIFESSPKLGGRCQSFIDNKSGEVIDNGQHLMMGAYTNFLGFINRIGANAQIDSFKKLFIPFYSTKGTSYTLSGKNLQGRLGMLVAILSEPHFSIAERLRFVKFMLKVLIIDSGKVHGSAALFLMRNKQGSRIIRDFWTPLVLAVLNTLPSIAPAKLLVNVLKKAFLSSPESSRMMYANTNFNAIFECFQNIVEQRKVEIRMNSRVKRILVQNGKAIGIELESKEICRADIIVSAVPYYALSRILPKDLLSLPNFKNLLFYKPSAILSAYLWYREDIETPAMFAMLDSSVQWVFNRRKMQSNYSNPEYKSSFAITISSSEQNNLLSKYELIENFSDELSAVLPEFNGKSPAHYRIIKENRATFQANLEIENYRVKQITDINGLYLCGDWTDTNLPATIEGACLSAEIVYKDIINRLN